MAELRVEFTVEPFVEADPGPHVTAALDGVRAAGLEPVMGPFSTVAEGDADAVADAVGRLVAAATASGATRLSIQIDAVAEPTAGGSI
jgi:uncharacterized protein YqgV (UPF0045/DUF77 family)